MAIPTSIDYIWFCANVITTFSDGGTLINQIESALLVPPLLNYFIFCWAYINNVNAEYNHSLVWIIEFNYGFKSSPRAISNLYLTCIIDYHMESTTALMFVVLGASMGLFGMILLVMIKTFQEVKSKMT